MIKCVIVFAVFVTLFSSCSTSIPLVVYNPEMPNGNIVTKQGDVSGGVSAIWSSKTPGEQNIKSRNVQTNVKYAVSNKFFVEADFFRQKEQSTLEREFRGVWSRTIDTIRAANNYRNGGYSVGVGYYQSINPSNQFFISASAGYRQQYFDITTFRNINNNPTTIGYANFKQSGIYCNMSVQFVEENVSCVFGIRQSFQKNKNIVLSGRLPETDSLKGITNTTQMPSQWYMSIGIAPFSIPLAFNMATSINIISLPNFLQRRAFTASLGAIYYPFKRGKKIKKAK